jgi:hypothetical protein
MIVKKIEPPVSIDRVPARQPMDQQNWLAAKEVRARFGIRHDGSSILLAFHVNEPQVRAVNTGFNSRVWEDSCVEFFLMLDGDPNYYNFEFNAIGTLLGAYGPDRHRRELLPEAELQQIRTLPSLGREVILNLEGGIIWTLSVSIPATTLCHSPLASLSGIRATGNFYKCGDLLNRPHYLSWQPVQTVQPDFHSPRFFGELVFE